MFVARDFCGHEFEGFGEDGGEDDEDDEGVEHFCDYGGGGHELGEEPVVHGFCLCCLVVLYRGKRGAVNHFFLNRLRALGLNA